MMQQYINIKKDFPKHILFFRLGDFYEMFFDDAIVVSKELSLTLTGRDCGLEKRAPMCGVPFHASETYLKKLIKKGYSVAICEQTSDPAASKGIVTREVIRIVTPGTLIEADLLNESVNNFIASVFYKGNKCAICFCDISTGEVHLYEIDGKDIENAIIDEISRFSPVEVLANDEIAKLNGVNSFINEKMNVSFNVLGDECYNPQKNTQTLLKQFNSQSLEDLSLEENEDVSLECLCMLFSYIFETQKALIGRFTSINIHKKETNMKLSVSARRNLELCETLRNKEKKGSLLWILDNVKTSMGKRMLKCYIDQPLIEPVRIINRLNAVEELYKNSVATSELQEALSGVYDLERLMTRVMYKTANPRDLKALQLTTQKLPEIKNILSAFSSKLLVSLDNDIDKLEEISNLINNSIIDEPPVSIKDGGIIKDGFNNELDNLRGIIKNSKDILDAIEQREKDTTGIKNLKIGYNRIFGYYIEVTKSYYDLVPDSYIRKQTLANCERYITNELKEAENTIIGANDKVVVLENNIYIEIRDFIATFLKKVQQTAVAVATVDVLASFAVTALKNGYTKPEIAINGVIDIKNGRHPVVEVMSKDEMFVPNDTYLDLTDNKMMIITGPNMSGKSTYMRQVALITIMAQMGSFVPADYAKISVVDQIFTRIGASDDLSAGQSTFMVEMSEVAEIVKNATKNSLVILDEVGRGTSTFDGISIARAVAEYILTSKNMGCKTLFATHYHELTELEKDFESIKNYSVAVKQRGDKIQFLRKIVRGAVDDSYGIEVAKLAGLPGRIISRAKALLNELEVENERKNKALDNTSGDQISFECVNESIIQDKLRKTNIDELSDDDLRYFVKDLLKYL